MANFQIDNLKPEWITGGLKNQDPVNWAKRFGDYLGDKFLWDSDLNIVKEKRYNPKTQKEEEVSKKSELTTTKLRNFFGEVKRIQIRLGFENGFKNETANIIMLKPKLAYAVGKETDANNKIKVKMFFEQFSKALDAIDVENPEEGKKHFKNFVQLMEAVVAYHKAKGGQ